VTDRPGSPRRREIADTARDLLDREGLEALTVGNLARELGIKPPSLYKHFDSKADLEALLIADGFEAFAAALEPAGDDLAALAAAYRKFAKANPQLYRLMTELPLPRDRLPDGREARAAAPIVRAAGGEDRARAVWAFAHGMVALELADRFPADADLDRAWRTGVAAFSAPERD
jgi:AcrR family transcriptional regulator